MPQLQDTYPTKNYRSVNAAFNRHSLEILHIRHVNSGVSNDNVSPSVCYTSTCGQYMLQHFFLNIVLTILLSSWQNQVDLVRPWSGLQQLETWPITRMPRRLID